MIDIHSHFLPGIDDGAKDPEMSLELIRMSEQQGIDGLVATPHYYSDISISHFLERRQRALEKILPMTDMPIALGAEVYYHPCLVTQDDLPQLCFGGSDYLLLELPFATFPERMYGDIQVMQHAFGLQIIVAHMERYMPFNSWRNIQRLIDLEVYVQVNASDLDTRNVKKLLKQDLVHFLASDMHHPTNRPQTLGTAVKNLGDASGMYINNSSLIFEDLPEVYNRK